MHQCYFLGKYFMKWKYIYIMNKQEQLTIQVYLYSAFHNANHCKAALEKITVSTLYLVIAKKWWLSQADVHMADCTVAL